MNKKNEEEEMGNRRKQRKRSKVQARHFFGWGGGAVYFIWWVSYLCNIASTCERDSGTRHPINYEGGLIRIKVRIGATLLSTHKHVVVC